MKICAITLCRSGSKRFPNKVLAPLCGKPLYMYTVETALALGYPYYFAHDYNSISLPEGVTEIRRNPVYSGDEHKTNEEIKSFNLDYDIYILLQVTNPIRNIQNMKSEIEFFIKNLYRYDCGFEVFPIEKGFYYDCYGLEINFNQLERNDNGCKFKKQIFKETGSFYIFKKKQLDKKHILDGEYESKRIFITNNDIDINYQEDLWKAEEIIKNGN